MGTGRNIVFGAIDSGIFPGLRAPPVFVPDPVDMNAEIWRYKKDDSCPWERVYKAPPQLGIVGFRFLIRYTTPQGETALYAGCYTIKPQITILKSTDGENWEPLITDIPGTSTRTMLIHREKLYMGVLDEAAGGSTMLYVSENPQKYGWAQIDTQGDPDRNPRGGIITMESFNGHIYVGTAPPGGFELWRTEGTGPETDRWILVIDKGAGDALNEIPLTLGVFRDQLFVGTAILSAIASNDPNKRLVPPKPFDLIAVNRFDRWRVIVGGEPVLPTRPVTGTRYLGIYPSGFGDISNGYCWQLRSYGGRLYLGTWDWSDLLPPFTASLWTINKDLMIKMMEWLQNPANPIGFVKAYNLKPLESMMKGSLTGFLTHMGFDLYVSNKPVTLDGLGNPCNYGLRNLFPSEDGRLYIGTANPFQGCEVWWMKSENKC